jgi:hypothetical protein
MKAFIKEMSQANLEIAYNFYNEFKINTDPEIDFNIFIRLMKEANKTPGVKEYANKFSGHRVETTIEEILKFYRFAIRVGYNKIWSAQALKESRFDEGYISNLSRAK